MSLLRSKSAKKTCIPAPKMCSKFSSLHSKLILTKAACLATCSNSTMWDTTDGYFIFRFSCWKRVWVTLIDFMILDSLQHVLRSWDKFIAFNPETKIGERQTNLSSIFLILLFTIWIVHYILMQNKWLTLEKNSSGSLTVHKIPKITSSIHLYQQKYYFIQPSFFCTETISENKPQ
jgi:hypothetical protein